MDLTRLSNLVAFFCVTFVLLRPLYRNFKRDLLRAHRLKIQLRFLKTCRAEKVIPKTFLPHRLRNFENIPFSGLDEVLLNAHIKEKTFAMKRMFQNASRSRLLLKNSVTSDWWRTHCYYVYSLLRLQNQPYTEKLDRK